MRSAWACAGPKAAGIATPRSSDTRRYSSTMRNASNDAGSFGPAWIVDTTRATSARIDSCSMSPSASGSPGTQRVMRHPCSGRWAMTSGPTPAAAAARAASYSATRSIPRSAVSLSDRRRKNASEPTSTRKLRLVRPASMGVIVGSCPRHPGHDRHHRFQVGIEAHGR